MLKLYALQIASGNLKRFVAEQSAAPPDPEQEGSLLKLFLEALQIPETPEELAAEMNTDFDDLNQPPAVYPLIGAPRDYSKPPPPWPPTGAATITKTSASKK